MSKKNAKKIIFLIITLSFFQNSLLISEFYNNNENYTDSTLENPFNRTDAQVTNHIVINDNGIASADEAYFTVIIINPIDEEVINGTVIISVECKDDKLGLDEVQIFINGELKSTTKMPDYLPYPEVTYELNTTEYENGEMNITAKAIDITGNSKNFSINVFINNTDSFWDFLPLDLQTAAIIGGVGLIGIIAIGTTLRRAKRKRTVRSKTATRGKVFPKKTRSKTARNGVVDKGYWKKTRSKTARDGVVDKGYWKKTRSKTARAGIVRKSHTKKTSVKSTQIGSKAIPKISTRKKFFSRRR